MNIYTLRQLFSYGLFGFPLALVALPIYIYVPQFYSEHFGLSLSAIGTALLLSRLLDAFFDPALGWWIDANASKWGYRRFISLSFPLLILGFVGLFHPPLFANRWPFLWFIFTLIVVYLGFSLATITYQSWGATLTQLVGERVRITATREACGLAGVVVAAGLLQTVGISWMSLFFALSLLSAGVLLIKNAPAPNTDNEVKGGSVSALTSFLIPWSNKLFRWLFGVFVLNGIAAAIPATLFLFFVKDRLQLADLSGIYLIGYFLSGAFSMPIWAALSGRFGEARTWLGAMILSIFAFIWAYWLRAGDVWPFAMICVMSGLALGADLSLPTSLLAAIIKVGGHNSQREGAYFGLWNWATKMNLAIAAGVSLPLLQMLGYIPNLTVNANESGVSALSFAYGILPCILKMGAGILLWKAPLRDL